MGLKIFTKDKLTSDSALLTGLALATLISASSCERLGQSGSDNHDRSRVSSVEDIHSMTIDPSDTTKFRVTCRYHTHNDAPELRTAQEIRDNQVCMGQGSAGACSYIGASRQSGQFRVIVDGRVYSQSVNGFDHARYSCGTKASVLYDGDDLWFFDATEKRFERDITPDENVTNAVLRSSGDLFVFYDQDDLFALDTKMSSLEWNKSILVEDNAAIFRVEALRGAAMIYDGDDLITYCGGKWERNLRAGDNDRLFTIQTSRDLLIGSGINGTWSLRADTCEME